MGTNLFIELRKEFAGCFFTEDTSLGSAAAYGLLLLPPLTFAINFVYFIDCMNSRYIIRKPRFYGDIYQISNTFIHIRDAYINAYFLLLMIISVMYIASYLIVYFLLHEKLNTSSFTHAKIISIIFLVFYSIICILLISYTAYDNKAGGNIGKRKHEFKYHIKDNVINQDFVKNNIEQYRKKGCALKESTLLTKVRCDTHWDIMKNYLSNFSKKLSSFSDQDTEQTNICKSVITYFIYKSANHNDYNHFTDDIEWINAVNANTNALYHKNSMRSLLKRFFREDIVENLIVKIDQIDLDISNKILAIRNISDTSPSWQLGAICFIFVFSILFSTFLFNKRIYQKIFAVK